MPTTPVSNPTTDASAPSVARDAAVHEGTYDFAPLDKFFDDRLASGVLHGFAMQIYDRNDHLVYQREAGVCATRPTCPPGEPAFTVSLTTGVASSSKWVTSSTVLTVLEEQIAKGKVASLDAALDTKVTPILDCPKKPTGPVTDITMRHLLSFTSGVIPDHPCVEDKASTLKGCACQILADSSDAMTTSPTKANAKTTASPPETTFKYGASHLTIAGAVIEAVTGKPWTTVFQEKVATPLNLSMTYKSSVNLAGSISASTEDYARFVRAIFHDGLGDKPKQILSKEAVLAQRAKQVPPTAVPLIIPLEGQDYGLNTWRWCYAPFDASVVTDLQGKLKAAPACDQVFQSGHGGKGGYQPFLDAGNGEYYAVLAVREESRGGGADYSPDEVALSVSARLLTHVVMTTPPSP